MLILFVNYKYEKILIIISDINFEYVVALRLNYNLAHKWLIVIAKGGVEHTFKNSIKYI